MGRASPETIPPGLWRIASAAGFYLATRQTNVALRVRERQDKPEENTLEGKVSGKSRVNFNLHAGVGKTVLLTKYLKYHEENKNRFKDENLGQFKKESLDPFLEENLDRLILDCTRLGLYSGDNPETPSKPTRPLNG